MNKQLFIFISLLFAAISCLGEMPNTNFAISVPLMLIPEEKTPAELLNDVANDRGISRSERAEAIFNLFRKHITPGDGLVNVNRVLGKANWLNETEIYYFGMLGGWIPVDMNHPNDRTYSLHLFPDKDGHSDWVIYFQIAGKTESGNWKEDGFNFLRGKVGANGDSALLEFALCSPNHRIEVFNRKHGTLVIPPDE